MKTKEQAEMPLPREAYTLLAQANLLRMRGRWAEAVEKCMAALRLAPESASAQSLLGDIYENQGRYDDAIQWYRMALDVNPDSPADKLKLGRLLEAGHRRITDSLHGERVDHAPTAAQPRRSQSDGGAERLLRGVAWLAAAFFVLAAALAGVVMSRQHTSPKFITAPSIVIPSPDTNASADPPGSGAPAAGTSPTTGSPAPLASAPTADPSEQALLQTLQQDTTLAGQNILPEDVQIDPRQNAVTLTVLCPTLAANSPARQALLRDAALAGQAGARAQGDRVSAWTVRCLQPPPGSAPDAAPGLCLVADTTTAALTALGPSPDTFAPIQLLPAFHNLWWSPSVPQ